MFRYFKYYIEVIKYYVDINSITDKKYKLHIYVY